MSFEHHKVAIHYQSGFFLFLIRSNKSIVVPFARWVIREAIQIAMENRKPKEVTKEDCKMMKLAS